jgi:peptidoglycan/LPS O-acetylase OafA/YrhL
MTTFAVPPTGSPAWREIYPAPPDVQTGRWCPIDDTTLKIRLDGYSCPACGAAWDFQGRSGRWLADTAQLATVEPAVRWWLSPSAVVAGVTGCALAAVSVVAVLGELDERLVWWLAAVVGAAAVLLVAGAWLARQSEDRRYRHNRVLRVVDGEVTR